MPASRPGDHLPGPLDPPPDFVSPAEFARSHGLSVTTVRRYVAAGRLPYEQPAGHGGRVLIPRLALANPPAESPAGASPAGRTSSNRKPAPAAAPIAGPRPGWRGLRGLSR